MRVLGILVVIAAVLGAGAAWWTVHPRLPAAERGRRLAESTGCFGCHGDGGTHGTANPGRNDKKVPMFQDDLMMYADTPQEVREWIADGVTAKRSHSKTWHEQRERGTLRMPAFRRRLAPDQIDDLTAYVLAVSGAPDPDDSLAARGRARAEALGCFGCHGPGGRLARPNPGSLKGYVPSWDGGDFPELVKDRAEFGEWVDHGVSRRFDRNPLARFFLKRAALHMPSYEHHLAPADVDTLWVYVRWLRQPDSTRTP